MSISPSIGPSLAAGGIGLLVPLTNLKKIDVQKYAAYTSLQPGTRVISEKDEKLVHVIQMLILIFISAWAFITLYANNNPGDFYFNLPLNAYAGLVIYLTSAVMVEIKEAV